jgi:hypothetical protein
MKYPKVHQNAINKSKECNVLTQVIQKDLFFHTYRVDKEWRVSNAPGAIVVI